MWEWIRRHILRRGPRTVEQPLDLVLAAMPTMAPSIRTRRRRGHRRAHARQVR